MTQATVVVQSMAQGPFVVNLVVTVVHLYSVSFRGWFTLIVTLLAVTVFSYKNTTILYNAKKNNKKTKYNSEKKPKIPETQRINTLDT